MTWIYFGNVDGVEMKTSLDSSLLTVMVTLNDVEIGSFLFDTAAHQLGKSQLVKNPARSRETEVDLSHDFSLTVIMTWTDVKIGTRNFDKGMCCAGVS